MKGTPTSSEIVNANVAKICNTLNEILTSHPALEKKIFEPGDLTLSVIFLMLLPEQGYHNDKEVLFAGLALELLDIAVLRHYPGVFGAEAGVTSFPQNIDIITGDYCYSRALEAAGKLKDPHVIKILARAITDISEGVDGYCRRKIRSGAELVSLVEKLCSLYRAAAEIAVRLCSKKQEFSEEVVSLMIELSTGIGGLKFLKRLVKKKEKDEAEKFAMNYFSKSIAKTSRLLKKEDLIFEFENLLT